jgi:hypothetical protein
MNFKLNRQRGVTVSGVWLDLNQCQIRVGETLVGYLQFGKETQIQPLFEFPHDALTDAEVANMASELEAIQGYPAKVQRPEQYSRKFVELAVEAMKQAENEDDDE